jgi:hypothetical protein
VVHLRQLLTAAGIDLDRMMDDWGQPVDTVGKEGPGIPDCDAPDAGGAGPGICRRGRHQPALSLPKGLLASSIRA